MKRAIESILDDEFDNPFGFPDVRIHVSLTDRKYTYLEIAIMALLYEIHSENDAHYYKFWDINHRSNTSFDIKHFDVYDFYFEIDESDFKNDKLMKIASSLYLDVDIYFEASMIEIDNSTHRLALTTHTHKTSDVVERAHWHEIYTTMVNELASNNQIEISDYDHDEAWIQIIKEVATDCVDSNQFIKIMNEGHL